MISIGTPYITKSDKAAYLRAKVHISDNTAKRYLQKTSTLINCAWLTEVDYPPAIWNDPDCNLWFSVPAEYADHLCCERSNAFVIVMLWYAMVTGSDISFEAPISERLYNGLTQNLIPALMKDTDINISLKGPITSEKLPGENGVVCGMSCGVDSMYTLNCYTSDDAPKNEKLTHLMYGELNYLFPRVTLPYDIDEIFDKLKRVNSKIIKNAEHTAQRHNMPFLHFTSNLDRDFYRGGYIYTAMYRYLACVLAMEKLFSVYIISSSGHVDRLEEVSLFSPTQHYENMICTNCGTEKLKYMISDHTTRIEKLKKIADNADFKDFANVCFDTDESTLNCGVCFGCMKTIIPLDILGKLNGFERVFDTAKYYADRQNIFERLILFSWRPEASAARESVHQILELSKELDNEAGREFVDVYNKLQAHLKISEIF